MKAVWAIVTAVAVMAGLASSAQSATRVGVLRCYVEGSTAYVVGSSHEASCIFRGYNGRSERYTARLKRTGLDLGYTGKSVIVWAVLAPSAYHYRALRGSYVGASGDIAFGVGAGANVLVGGNGRTISLQPLSVKAETGVTVALGAGELELR
jgi:hypothetical protein